MTKNKGFTLIELLVVIAIIGILSSIVLSSLSSSRRKAQMAKLESTFVQVKNGIALCCSNPNNILQDSMLGDLCGPDESSAIGYLLQDGPSVGIGGLSYSYGYYVTNADTGESSLKCSYALDDGPGYKVSIVNDNGEGFNGCSSAIITATGIFWNCSN